MKIESFARIAIVTFVLVVWIVMGLGFARSAFANDDEKPKPKPAPTIISQPQEPERHKENFWGGAAFGGLAVTALQKTEHPTLYAIGGGVATAAFVEASQPGGFNAKNFRYAAAGVALGASGTGFVFGRRFFGWRTTFK